MSLRCLIAGGGIGGLALAAGLLREGFEPLVLEQAPSLQPVGAGVNLTPNAMKALTWLGVDKHVRQSGVAGDGFLGVDLESGEEIFSHPMTGQAEAEYGDKLISTYRPDLVEALMARLSPAHIRLGSAVSDIRQDDTSVRARLASGEEISGDVLIGADGLNSAVRTELFGALEPRFTGYAA